MTLRISHVRPQHPLASEADLLRDPLRSDVVDVGGQGKALKTQVVEGVAAQASHRTSRDASPANLGTHQ